MNVYNDFPKNMLFDKELNEEELELIKSEYKKLQSINKMKLDSNSYQLYLDKNNDVYFPKGTLIYGTNANLDNIKFISNNGILASEFNGTTNNYGTYYSSLFYKTDRDILLKEYVNDIDDDNMPFNNCNEKIAFIVNPTSKIGGLLYYDLLDTKFDNNPIVRNIIDPLVKNDLCKKRNELSLILVGVPANSISGIVLGDKLIIDKDIVDKIKRLFPNAYIINRRGNIISILKKNTSYFEQAKIFTSLGYKLPKGLSSKLSIEEAKALKEIKH